MKAPLQCVLVAGLLLTPAGNACAQFVPFATVVVQSYPDRVAAPYDFEVWFTSIVDNDAVTIEAPDGTVFDLVPEYSVIHHELHNLTATDLNRFIGKWTINDFQGLPNGVAPQKHTFIISERPFRTFPPVPRIISPADGAILPPVFNVKSTSGGMSLRTPQDVGSLERLSQPAPKERRYKYGFNPGVTEAEIQARATDQLARISNASAPGQANRRFSVWMINDIYAPPLKFTVRVPEPAAFATCCFALVVLAALRRCK